VLSRDYSGAPVDGLRLGRILVLVDEALQYAAFYLLFGASHVGGH